MTDILRSAFHYISQAGPNLLSAGNSEGGGRTDHPMVGSVAEIGQSRYRIRSLLAEGGYALVFAVQEQKTGRWLAMKRQLAADKEAANAVKQEIHFLRQLTGHPSIIEFHGASELGPRESGTGRAEFLLLTELCSGGPLINVVQKRALTPEQICKIFHGACSAVEHMHDRNPPITHRDIKIENLLFSSSARIKLCDFGSATTDIYRPSDDWSALKRGQLEEEMARHTTPMYRAPEILDTYQNYPIGPSQDVWALGCILYYLCYRQHPFEDSAKLRILNAKYSFPPPNPDCPYTIFHQLIQSTLQPNPYSRPSIHDLCERMNDLAFTLRVNLTEPVLGLDLPTIGQPVAEPPAENLKTTMDNSRGARSRANLHSSGSFATAAHPQRPHSTQPRSQHASESQPATTGSAEMLYQLKGQGLSLFKNLKDRGQQIANSVLNTSAQAQPSHQAESRRQGEGSRGGTPVSKQERGTFRDSSPPPPPPPHRYQSSQRVPTPPIRKVQETRESAGLEEGQNEFDPFETHFPNPTVPAMHKCEIAETTRADIPDEEKEGLERSCSTHSEYKKEREQIRNEDLLSGWTYAAGDTVSAPPRHVASAPAFPTEHGDDGCWGEDLLKPSDEENEYNAPVGVGKASDPLEEFLASSAAMPAEPKEHPANYSRKQFDQHMGDSSNNPKSSTPANSSSHPSLSKPAKLGDDTFNELLSSQGFPSQHSAERGRRTLADLKRDERRANENDPVRLKIDDWTQGKERNIRALLSSLHEVLWEDIGANWTVPMMSDLLSNHQIKKNYYKACLVVHPDKQVGTPHELLAKAIFTELNDAWNKFEEERKQTGAQ